MRTNVHPGWGRALLGRVPGMEEGLRGFAFDLQRFSSLTSNAITTDGGKVTLTLRWDENGNFTNGTLDSSAADLSDGANVYGTVKKALNDYYRETIIISLNSVATPINEIIVENAPLGVNICNAVHLAAVANLKVSGENSLRVYDATDSANPKSYIAVAALADSTAEVTYQDHGTVTAAKNAEISLCNKAAALPDGGVVKHLGSGVFQADTILSADSNGRLATISGSFYATGKIAVEARVMSNYSVVQSRACDENGKELVEFLRSGGGSSQDMFKGTFDGTSNKVTIEQGAFEVSVDYYTTYEYAVNPADKSIIVTEHRWDAEAHEMVTTPVAKEYYASLSAVSFQLPEDLSTLADDTDLGMSGVSDSPIVDPAPVPDTADSNSNKHIIITTPGETKVIEKYDVKEDIIELSGQTGELAPVKILVDESGILTYGNNIADGIATNGAVDISSSEKNGAFAARLADRNGNNKQLVAWTGDKSAIVDMRRETKGVVMKDGGNEEKDTFYGGKGRDTITLGSEDIARGGAGSDLIIIGEKAQRAEVALQSGDGHDRVQGFGFGFDDEANVVSLSGGKGVSRLSVDGSGRLQLGDATLEFAGTDLLTAGQTDLLVRDGHGLQKVSLGNKLAATGEETADIYYGTDKNAELDFSALRTNALVIDLNNNFGHTTADVHGVKKVTGADEAENILIGENGRSNTIIGGAGAANSLYGGLGGNDTLIGSGTSEDSFYFGLGSGRDKIENFGEEDKLQFLDGNYGGASLDEDGHLKFKWSDAQGHTATLTLDEDVRDQVITYDMGDGAHGAKFGSSLTITDDTADFVNYYKSSGGYGELVLSGADDKSIWLDGSQGVAYDGFRKVDASSLEGGATLAGGTKSEELIAGQGDSSLWGGAGGNDTLTGGSGENEFYFGTGNGKDVITSSNDEDKVMLYDVTLEDIDGGKSGLKDGRMVIALNDGSTLTIENYKSHGAETFQLADSTWSYDKQTGDWTQLK